MYRTEEGLIPAGVPATTDHITDLGASAPAEVATGRRSWEVGGGKEAEEMGYVSEQLSPSPPR